MAEAAELNDSFDDEFEAARSAESESDDAAGAGGDDEAGQGEGDGEGEGAQARQPLDPQALEKRWRDTQRALKAERHTKRELQDRLERLEASAQPRGGQAQGEGEMALPSPTEDPIGWMQAAQKLIDRMQSQERESAERQQQSQEQSRNMSALQTRVNEYEDDFRADHPDYDEATKFLKDSVAEELSELGLTGAALTAEFNSRLIGIVTRALASGKDPAEVSYTLAQKRGFGVDKGAASLQKIVAGQKASRSLGASGGRQQAGALDARAVSDLKGAAFDAAFEKLRAQERKRG